MGVKLKWKVSDVPTGKFRSFEVRAWPSAEFEDGSSAAMILCDAEYAPRNVKTGNHPPLRICVADYSVDKTVHGTFVWRTLSKRAATLKEAKEITQRFFELSPDFMPKEGER